MSTNAEQTGANEQVFQGSTDVSGWNPTSPDQTGGGYDDHAYPGQLTGKEQGISYVENSAFRSGLTEKKATQDLPPNRRRQYYGNLDQSLISRCFALLDETPEDEIEMTNNFAALRGTVVELWESAVEASEYHQEILAILDNAFLSTNAIKEDQVKVIKEALRDLKIPILTQANVDAISSQFIQAGFNPLAHLGELSDHDE